MIVRSKITLLIILLSTSVALFGQNSKIHIANGGSKTIIKNHSTFSSFNVEMRGRIELTDDDKDVKSMSPDGYLEIKKTVFGSRRTLKITPGESGLNREYYEGRTKVSFEPDGRQWMNEILPELARSTTIGAQSRVNRFYKQGGAVAVTDEIERLESNFVKSHYANLLAQKSLSTAEYVRVIDRVSRTIDSNYYLSEFLKENLDTFLKSEETTEAVFRATDRIDSDHYKTLIIKSGLRDQSISTESVKIILSAAGNMDSDHYKTEVLTSLMNQSLNEIIMSEIINTTKSIDSDHYRSVVLNKALEDKNLSIEAFIRSIESVANIDSDHYKSEVLTNLLESSVPNEVHLEIIKLTNSINSDHYTMEVLNALLENQNLSDQSFESLVLAATSIDSDHYASSILETALSSKLTETKMIKLLEASAKIDSDSYLAEVLQAAAPSVRSMSEIVIKAYRDAASNIESETYYGRTIRALERH